MDCKRCRVEIEEAGRDAPPGAGVESHLAACALCRAFRAERASLRGLVAGLARVDAPNDFEFRLRARLAAEGAGRARGGWRTYFPRAAWVALAGCLLLAVGVALRPSRTTTTTPAVADINSQPSPVATTGAGGQQAATVAGGKQSDTNPPAAPVVPVETTLSSDGVEVAKAGGDDVGRSVVNVRHGDRRRRRQTILPRNVAAEIASGVGAAGRFEEHARSVIGGTVIPLQVSAEERPLQVTFKDMQGASRVVRVEPVAFGSREPNVAGARVVNATHKQGVW